MKIYTRIEMDIETGQVIDSESFEYSGPVAECKAASDANQQRKDELAMQKQSFGLMQQRQNQVGGAVGKYLTGSGEGFDPKQLALMRSQFLNSNAAQYQNAGRNLRTSLLRTGSSDSSSPVGGDYVRGIAGLEGGMANNASSGLANIDLQNLSMALNNKFNAASLINGQAAQLTSPISSFGQDASSALNSYVTASQNGIMSQFTKALGGGLGMGLTGGIGGALSSLGKFGSGFNKGAGG